MFACPNCQNRLSRIQNELGQYWACPNCRGRAVSVPLLRKAVTRNYVNQLWSAVRDGHGAPGRRCPACDRPMLEVVVSTAADSVKLDVCKGCEFVWFDASEYESAPPLPPAPKEPDPTPAQLEARAKLAIYEARLLTAQEREVSPDARWKTLPALFGLPVEFETEPLQHIPWLTWTLTALITLVSFLAFTNLEDAVQDFGLIPAEAWRYAGATLLTSFFLHAGLWHLFSNLYFLIIFGSQVEECIGWEKLFVLLVCATLAGFALHILGEPHSQVPCVGASGGISGIIAFYALKFPRAKLGFLFRYLWFFGYFRWVRLPAWGAFALWILLQVVGALKQLSGFGGVSALAHLGGAAVGFAFWWKWRNIELQPATGAGRGSGLTPPSRPDPE